MIKNFKILKANRVWYECTIDGYKVKLKVNEASKNLSLGDHTLDVKNITITTDTNSDIRYEIASDYNKNKLCFFKHRYNKICVDMCKQWCGSYKNGVWVFSDIVQEKVDDLEELFNSEEMSVEITATRDHFTTNGSVDFCGYVIAKASNRYLNAKLGDDVYMISGKIVIGGSMENWNTHILKDSVFRLRVPKKVLEKYCDDGFEYKILD